VEEVFVCSTGVIGVPLPVEKILRALPVIARHCRPSARSFAELSLAICTTDTRPKTAATSFKMAGKRIHLVGCAKGAGMIHPNMATMLAFIATDAAVAPSLLQRTLREVTGRTFNAISVDGDTSTNDTLLVLANGKAGLRGRRPERGPHLRRRRPRGSKVRSCPGRHQDGGHPRFAARPAARFQRARRQQQTSHGACSARGGSARGQSNSALLDMRF